jgi:hypothetical protein
MTVILRKLLDKWGGSKMDFIRLMESTFQTKVLGSEESPTHWKLKYSQQKDCPPQIDVIQVCNNVVRCMIANIYSVIECGVTENDNEIRAKLILALSNYMQGMNILTSQTHLDVDEKQLFQDYMDNFFEGWVELFGEDGMSNYIHLLGAGHMLYFLEKYDCLFL